MICTPSKYNRYDGADEWVTYKHKHYSTLHDRICWYESHEAGPLYQCKPCKKLHLIRDAERVPLIVTSTAIYKWWETETKLDELHIEYIQIPGASVKELLVALKTEYTMEKRPLDVLVIAGEIDTSWNMGEAIFSELLLMRNWILKKNKANTCAFSTIPTIPHEIIGAPALSLLKIRTHDLNARIMRQNQIDESTPRKFNTWGVKETGYEEGTKTRYRTSDWAELLFGDNTRGGNAKCFKQSKTVAQGRACLKFFGVKYDLDEKTKRPVQRTKSPEEKKRVRNRNRLERRKRRNAALRQEEFEQKEAEALKTLDGPVLEETLMALYAENDEDDGGI